MFQWPAFFADVIASLLLAVILSLSIEAPALTVEKCLFGRGKLYSAHVITIYVCVCVCVCVCMGGGVHNSLTPGSRGNKMLYCGP